MLSALSLFTDKKSIILLLFSLYLIIGARRFAVLDFGRPILLTDIYIPSCSDLASLSVDVWNMGEEQDGRRLAVALDIGTKDLVMNDLLPPAVCRYLKVWLKKCGFIKHQNQVAHCKQWFRNVFILGVSFLV